MDRVEWSGTDRVSAVRRDCPREDKGSVACREDERKNVRIEEPFRSH
jgi:hypothetical protein